VNPTQQQEFNDRNFHEYFEWATTKNKAAALSGFVTLAGYLSFFGIFNGVIVGNLQFIARVNGVTLQKKTYLILKKSNKLPTKGMLTRNLISDKCVKMAKVY